MKVSLIIGIVVVVLVILGVYLMANQGASTNGSSGNNGNQPPIIPNEGTEPRNEEPEITQAQIYNVDIKGFVFRTKELRIKQGDTVIWTNRDSASHTVTSDTEKELGSSLLSEGQTYSHTFNTAGTYEYRCTLHPNMKAKVIVE